MQETSRITRLYAEHLPMMNPTCQGQFAAWPSGTNVGKVRGKRTRCRQPLGGARYVVSSRP